MEIKEIPKGQVIFESGQKINAFHLIAKGTVEVIYPGGKYLLHGGDILGLCELDRDDSYVGYRAVDDVSLIEYPMEEGKPAESVFSNTETLKYFMASLFRQLYEMFRQYKQLESECETLYGNLSKKYGYYIDMCTKFQMEPTELEGQEGVSGFFLEEGLPFWMMGYYVSLKKIMVSWDYEHENHDFVYGFFTKAGEDLRTIIDTCYEPYEYKNNVHNFILNEKGVDIFGRLLSLYEKAALKYGSRTDDIVEFRNNLAELLMQLRTQGFGGCPFYQERLLSCKEKMKEIEQRSQAGPEEKEEVETAEDNTSGEKKLSEAFTQEEEEEDLTLLPQLSWGELSGSLRTIMDYAKCESNLETSFIDHIQSYKAVANKNGTEEEVRLLRQRITKEFCDVYTCAFRNSIEDENIPVILKMFFNFGYVDEELAGEKNALFLSGIAGHLPTSPERGVYTFYEWLLAVYKGEKEPSRNEFDLDYPAFLVEQRKTGKITKEEEKELLEDNMAKVNYELENVFPLINKLTFGRITTFCPVFSEHNVMKGLDAMLVSARNIAKILADIQSKDYAAYYRETMFTAPERGIDKEFIHVEILPDFILTPNVGNRGVMWQEIEGKKRTTPARMFSSIFQMEELATIVTRLTGEFRWEMCKRMQGARWNDLSERSLTSEYFDYIQFYRKNSELSPTVKEKIKNDMGRAKNSFKEMFIMDYITWMLYESSGSPRLNKVSRSIMFNYCTFTRGIREKLKANPMYQELAERYEIRMGQKRHRVENICQKLRSTGKPIPEEIEKEREFLSM